MIYRFGAAMIQRVGQNNVAPAGGACPDFGHPTNSLATTNHSAAANSFQAKAPRMRLSVRRWARTAQADMLTSSPTTKDSSWGTRRSLCNTHLLTAMA